MDLRTKRLENQFIYPNPEGSNLIFFAPPGGHRRQAKGSFMAGKNGKVSPRRSGAGSPFEGGVAGKIDYLIFTRFISRPGWLI